VTRVVAARGRWADQGLLRRLRPATTTYAGNRRLADLSSKARRVLVSVVAAGLITGLAGGRISLLSLPSGAGQASAWRYELPDVPADATAEYQELFSRARGLVARVLERHPERAGAVAALALLYYLAHDPQGETACWERCVELDPRHSLGYSRLVALAQQESRYDRIVQLMETALEANPDNSSCVGILASALRHLDRSQEACRVLEEHHRHVPGTADTYLVLGLAYHRLGRWEDAMRSLETAVVLDQERVDALYQLSLVCARLGQSERAKRYRELFDRYKSRQMDQERTMGDRHRLRDELFMPQRIAEILRLAATACLADDDLALARQCLVEAVAIDPKDTQARRMLSSLCERQGKLDEALVWVRQLQQLEPQEWEHVKNEGILLARLGRSDEAERVLRELCRRAPERGVGYLGLAELYFRSGQDPAQARQLCERAIELEPTPRAWALLAALAERAGEMDTARAALREAIRLDPNNPTYRQMHETLQGRQ